MSRHFIRNTMCGQRLCVPARNPTLRYKSPPTFPNRSPPISPQPQTKSQQCLPDCLSETNCFRIRCLSAPPELSSQPDMSPASPQYRLGTYQQRTETAVSAWIRTQMQSTSTSMLFFLEKRPISPSDCHATTFSAAIA